MLGCQSSSKTLTRLVPPLLGDREEASRNIGRDFRGCLFPLGHHQGWPPLMHGTTSEPSSNQLKNSVQSNLAREECLCMHHGSLGDSLEQKRSYITGLKGCRAPRKKMCLLAQAASSSLQQRCCQSAKFCHPRWESTAPRHLSRNKKSKTHGIATSSKKLLVAPGHTTRNKNATSSKGHRY